MTATAETPAVATPAADVAPASVDERRAWPDWKVLDSDCLHGLPTLPAESVHAVVTSPPYFNLRDYDVPPTDWPAVEYAPMAGLPPLCVPAMACCLGEEPTIEAYVAHLVLVFRGVWRVLRNDGCLWLNLGDSYADDTKWGGATGNKHRAELHGKSGIGRTRRQTGLKPKDLCMVPARVALALQADGWTLRRDICWDKVNGMPEAVKDRPTTSHEYLFLLTKGPRYYYDFLAAAEPASGTDAIARVRNKRSVWRAPEPLYRLREDLTPEQRAYVLRRISDEGLL